MTTDVTTPDNPNRFTKRKDSATPTIAVTHLGNINFKGLKHIIQLVQNN